MSSSPPPARWHDAPAKSILRIQGLTDPWFVARYGMNLYRGCEHGCHYCDGRAERYHVDGDFARDIRVKTNAPDLLRRQLAKLPEPGFVFLGGGVSDSWQPAEAHHRLARRALELLLARALPVHVLTKSALVERDLDLLEAVHARSRAILAFSIQTIDDGVRARFEPGAAPIEERFRILRQARARGIHTGVMAMPVLPGVSDQPEAIDALLGRCAEEGVDFVMCGGLTLRPGRQRDAYLAMVRRHHPELLDGYARVYATAKPSGGADPRYYRRLEARFHDSLLRHDLPGRMPREIFAGVLPRYAELAVLLEHREYALAREGLTAPWLGRTGMALQRWAKAELGALRRRRRPDAWREVELLFRELLGQGGLEQVKGLDLRAIPEIHAIAATLPAPKRPGQQRLF